MNFVMPPGVATSSTSLQASLSAGADALRRGDLLQAERHFRNILSHIPGEPNANHLLALVHRRQGRLSMAETLMRRALETSTKPAEIHNNLGNLLKDTDRLDEALISYGNALEADPSFADAWFNKGLTLQRQGDGAAACAALQQALALKPAEARYANALGVCLKDEGRLQDAERAYRQALDGNPGYIKALNNLGALLRQMNRQSEALTIYEKAVALAPRLPELRYNLGNVLYELDQQDKADEAYRTAIALKPDYLEVHETLNRIYWESGRHNLFGRSYAVAIDMAPQVPALYETAARSHELADQTDTALNMVDRGLHACGPVPGLLRRKARLIANRGDVEAAFSLFHQALQGAPDDTGLRMDTARLLIQKGQYDDALHHLDHVKRIKPYDQEMWAFRGLCWRLTGDERDHWLNDYERFVQSQPIDVPDGYGLLEDFLADLEEALLSLHRTTTRPLDQTLRGGTQTHGHLFKRDEPVIQALRQMLERAVLRYINDLPDDDTHPLLSRKTDRIRFAGAWSVCLSGSGFHVNHVHSAGWISSAFYVALPPSDDGTDAAREGWIKFGESGLDLGPERERIGRVIRPEAGLLALFPSYVWHGTYPFAGAPDVYRLTAPFDAVPL